MERFTQALLSYRLVLLCLALFLLLYGFYSLRKTPLDAIPDLTDVQVVIYSEWMGQTPQVIEDQITYPVSSNMLGLPHVKAVRSVSVPNYSLVYVIFEDGTDLYWARSRVLEKLQSIRSLLPQQARVEIGPDATGIGWVYQYVLVSDRKSLDELWSIQNFFVKYALLSVPNVSEVASVGGFEKEYRIILKPEFLSLYNLSVEDVAKAVSSANVERGGKYVEYNGREFLIALRGYVKEKEDIERAVIKEVDGVPVRVGDVARVVETPALRMGTADYNGMGNAVGGIVIMRYGANAYETIKSVKEKLQEVQRSLPPDVRIVPVYDRSELIRGAVDNLKEVLIKEAIVVSAVIIVFLLHLSASLVVIFFLVLSVLSTFILMNHMGITSNIMSLGGIAIAIGTMVDASIVIVEAVQRKREEGKDLFTSITESMAQVGKPIFFALLMVTVSFVPMLALEGQSKRLFAPLVYTKTFSMLLASLFSIIFVPAFLSYFMKGKGVSEEKNPVVVFLVKLYEPLYHIVVRLRYLVLALTLLMGLGSYLIYRSLGSEFMPDLKEGTLLYMPVTAPGMSIQQAQELLRAQDRIIKSFPEVESVFGKAGRANTPTDPAPLSMIETTITLKPQDQWRQGMTYEKLIEELDRALQLPGVVNMWTQPIKGRIDMVSTGIRTPLGVKVYGRDLSTLGELLLSVESALKGMEGVMSVSAQRIGSATYLEIIPDRKALELYGVKLEDLIMSLERLLANTPVSLYISGRERYPISLGVPLDYRQDIENMLLPIEGKLLPIGALAQVRRSEGPMEVNSENGLYVGYVLITPKPDADMDRIVREGDRLIKESVDFPEGYYYAWSGQYEYWKKAKERLSLIVPAVLLIIFILIYLSFGSLRETLLVIFVLPACVFGGFLMMKLMGYKISLASIAGFLALLGISAEMVIVMLVYMINSVEERGREDLESALYEGAVKRIRPKAMTMITILAGLVPAVFFGGVGSEVMSRIALPMLGGVISSFFVALLCVPALYYLSLRISSTHR